MSCFSAKHVVLRSKSRKDWLAGNQDKMSERGNMSTRNMFQSASTVQIRVISKLPNTVQYYILTWYSHFERNGGLNQVLRRQTARLHYGYKVPVVTIRTFLTILGQHGYNSRQRKSIVYYRRTFYLSMLVYATLT